MSIHNGKCCNDKSALSTKITPAGLNDNIKNDYY